MRIKNVAMRSFALFSRANQIKLYLVATFQVLLALLDLLGVFTIGIIGILTINGITSNQPSENVARYLTTFGISQSTFQSQVAILGIIAGMFFTLKTILSIYLNRKILFFLSYRTSDISNRLMRSLLTQSPAKLKEKSTQEFIYAITHGVNNLTMGVVATLLSIVADFAVFLLLSIGLFVVDPVMAIASMTLFAITFVFLYKTFSQKVKNLGFQSSQIFINANEKFIEILSSFREILIRGRRDFYISSISESKFRQARISAELSFVPSIGKYVIESMLVVGSLTICAIQFLSKNAVDAIATLSVFIAAGTRIAPAIMRIQQGAIQIKSNFGQAEKTLELIESLENFQVPLDVQKMRKIDFNYSNFDPTIQVSNLTIRYSPNETPTLKNVNLTIERGTSVAIIGRSGAGKTTLVDAMLGLIEPESGDVKISQISPMACVSKWPGSISYVPQNIYISKGSILENVALGFDIQEVDLERVFKAIEIAQLADFVANLKDGIYSKIGEFGLNISGGQRQRLGIARALYTNPKLIFLDEATSALDMLTESDFGKTLLEMKKETTVVLIAHRLTTVKLCRKVIYLKDGEVAASGAYADVMSRVNEIENRNLIFNDV